MYSQVSDCLSTANLTSYFFAYKPFLFFLILRMVWYFSCRVKAKKTLFFYFPNFLFVPHIKYCESHSCTNNNNTLKHDRCKQLFELEINRSNSFLFHLADLSSSSSRLNLLWATHRHLFRMYVRILVLLRCYYSF